MIESVDYLYIKSPLATGIIPSGGILGGEWGLRYYFFCIPDSVRPSDGLGLVEIDR